MIRKELWIQYIILNNINPSSAATKYYQGKIWDNLSQLQDKQLVELSQQNGRSELTGWLSLVAIPKKYPNKIAAVISEPERPGESSKEYLAKAILLAHKNGAIFICDEMITGFKTDFPGSQTKFNVEPDISTWGKGIANGFSFAAMTGKRDIMSLGGIKNEGNSKLFLISTTHGGETHSISACLATINEFSKSGL